MSLTCRESSPQEFASALLRFSFGREAFWNFTETEPSDFLDEALLIPECSRTGLYRFLSEPFPIRDPFLNFSVKIQLPPEGPQFKSEYAVNAALKDFLRPCCIPVSDGERPEISRSPGGSFLAKGLIDF